MSLRYIVNQAN